MARPGENTGIIYQVFIQKLNWYFIGVYIVRALIFYYFEQRYVCWYLDVWLLCCQKWTKFFINLKSNGYI